MDNNEQMIAALKHELGKSAMEKARLTVLAMRLRAALISGEGRNAVLLRESEFLASPEQAAPETCDGMPAIEGPLSKASRAHVEQAAPVVRDNAEQAFEDAVLTGTGWMRTPTPSAETIDTAAYIPWAPKGSVIYDRKFATLLSDWRSAGGDAAKRYAKKALVLDIDARIAEARKETDKQNRQQVAAAFGLSGGPSFAWSYLLGLIESAVEADESDRDVAAAAREQALEEAAHICDEQADRARTEPGNARAAACADLIRALKTQPATHPAPAAGLHQVPVTTYLAPDGVTHWPAYSHEQREAYALAILAQQPAQAVAVPEGFPAGALHNGEVFANQLENIYDFECQAGPLRNCTEWIELRRCLRYIADYLAAPLAMHEGKAGDAEGEFVEKFMCDMQRDAKRYRWLRMQDWFDGPLCVLRDPKRALTSGKGLGADCPSRDRLDAAIDAAIASAAGKEGA